MIVMAYMHPWTLQRDAATDHVPHLSRLRPDGSTWEAALRTWLDGRILCEESKRYVGNFLAVHRVRPQEHESEDEYLGVA